MTDTAALIDNRQGISSDVAYSLKHSSCRGRSMRASILPTNAMTFAPGSQAIMYIPGGRKNTYLDTTQTYLRGTLRNLDPTNAMYFDGGGWSVINRLDSFSAGNLLESCQQYNVLYSYLMDFGLSYAQREGMSAMLATSSATTTTMRQGYDVSGSSTSVNGQYTFCLPILSCVVGTGLDKMLPLGELNDDIRLEFTFESQIVGMCAAAGTPNWSIIDFEIEAVFVELSDEGQQMVNSTFSPERPIYLHGNSWRHYVQTLPANQAGGFSYLVPARFASLKTLVVCPRRSTEVTANVAYSVSSRVNPNIAFYNWRVGSAIIPQKMVYLENLNSTGSYSEVFAEIMKAFHSLDNPANSSSVNQAMFNVCDNVPANLAQTGVMQGQTGVNSCQNAFAISTELELFSQRSDLLVSGLNTLSTQVFFEGTINTAPTVSYTLDFYANYDVILVIENGIMSAKF